MTTFATRVVALAVLLVAGLATAAWAWGGDEGSDVQASREEVMSLGSQFVKRLGTYDPEMVEASGQMPAYREQVREVITPKFSASFDEEVATAEQLVAQGGVTRSTQVFATAVSSIDDDSARVLVAGAFTDSYTQGKGEKARTLDQEPLPFRFAVEVVRIDGEWLVDDFAPVGAAPAGGTGEVER